MYRRIRHRIGADKLVLYVNIDMVLVAVIAFSMSFLSSEHRYLFDAFWLPPSLGEFHPALSERFLPGCFSA